MAAWNLHYTYMIPTPHDVRLRKLRPKTARQVATACDRTAACHDWRLPANDSRYDSRMLRL